MILPQDVGSFQDAIELYTEMGWIVLPANKKTKSPTIRWGEVKTREDCIKNLNMACGYSGLAIRTGDCSNLCVLDVDPRNGGSLDRWGLTNDLATVRSPSGGSHFYVWIHPGSTVRELLCRKKAPLEHLRGIDIQYENKIIMCPPTEGYKIVSGVVYDDDDDRIVAFLTDAFSGESSYIQPSCYRGMLNVRIPQIAKPVGKGVRHITALSMAGRLAGYNVSYESALITMLLWANECDPPMDEKEVERIVKYVYEKEGARKGKQNPI